MEHRVVKLHNHYILYIYVIDVSNVKKAKTRQSCSASSNQLSIADMFATMYVQLVSLSLINMSNILTLLLHLVSHDQTCLHSLNLYQMCVTHNLVIL